MATADTDLGTILVDGEGRTLYLFMPDAQGASMCLDSCATTWPPLAGPATAGDGVDEALLSTADRPDGAAQVTYNGWPLYHFASDAPRATPTAKASATSGTSSTPAATPP